MTMWKLSTTKYLSPETIVERLPFSSSFWVHREVKLMFHTEFPENPKYCLDLSIWIVIRLINESSKWLNWMKSTSRTWKVRASIKSTPLIQETVTLRDRKKPYLWPHYITFGHARLFTCRNAQSANPVEYRAFLLGKNLQKIECSVTICSFFPKFWEKKFCVCQFFTTLYRNMVE